MTHDPRWASTRSARPDGCGGPHDPPLTAGPTAYVSIRDDEEYTERDTVSRVDTFLHRSWACCRVVSVPEVDGARDSPPWGLPVAAGPATSGAARRPGGSSIVSSWPASASGTVSDTRRWRRGPNPPVLPRRQWRDAVHSAIRLRRSSPES
jgi:hypothetical protein